MEAIFDASVARGTAGAAQVLWNESLGLHVLHMVSTPDSARLIREGAG